MTEPMIRTRGATFSRCSRYRYDLTRWIRPYQFPGETVTFIMLNPSMADAYQEDPTVRRCLGFATNWGYEYVRVLNIFALRSTDPKALKVVADPVGEHNDLYIEEAAEDDGVIVIAWGTHGAIEDEHGVPRGDRVRNMLMDRRHDNVWQLGPSTQAGHPRHPLYLKGDTPLIRCRR